MAEPFAWLDEREASFKLTRDAETSAGMSEGEFRQFYERTARPLLLFLDRLTGNRAQAEDLMQESFLRVLRAGLGPLDAAQRKNYLYKTALNLVRDHGRSPASRSHKSEAQEVPVPPAPAAARLDVHRVLAQVSARDRALLWLAYAEGATHREIAGATGLREDSIRPMLFRARQRVAQLLRSVR